MTIQFFLLLLFCNLTFATSNIESDYLEIYSNLKILQGDSKLDGSIGSIKNSSYVYVGNQLKLASAKIIQNWMCSGKKYQGLEFISIDGIIFQTKINLLAPKKQKKKTRIIILDWTRTGLIRQEANSRNRQDIRDRMGKVPKSRDGELTVKKAWRAGTAMKVSFIMPRN